MNRLAIVSSYSESCGNATFTKVLHDTIESHADLEVEVMELDLKLLQSAGKLERKKADRHVKLICNKLKLFDAVNIQLEAALYGVLHSDIFRRVSWLVKANPNTSVTLHSPRIVSSLTVPDLLSSIKKILKLNIISGIKDLYKYIFNPHINLNRKLIKCTISRKCHLIVHTIRAKKQIQAFFSDYERISVHPLKIVPENFVSSPITLKKIREQIGLPDSDVLIGMFGYISPYKGHADALFALQHLPSNYKLLIFGRQHPQTLRPNGKRDKYLEELIKIYNENKTYLEKRVFFLGELSDDEFLQVASCVDVTWLPYHENGQDGSGIASICLDVCKRVVCSTSFAFDELFKLIPYENTMRFDIGNVLELANKTMMILRREVSLQKNTAKDYNIKTQVLTYTCRTSRCEVRH